MPFIAMEPHLVAGSLSVLKKAERKKRCEMYLIHTQIHTPKVP